MPNCPFSVVLATEIHKWALKLFATQTLKAEDIVQKILFVNLDPRLSE